MITMVLKYALLAGLLTGIMVAKVHAAPKAMVLVDAKGVRLNVKQALDLADKNQPIFKCSEVRPETAKNGIGITFKAVK